MTDIERQDSERREDDIEELAAFIDGRLSGERKARMEQRLLVDEELYEVFLETVRFREQEGGAASVTTHPRAFAAAEDAGSAPARPWVRRRWWPAAALAAAAVVALVVVLPRGERSAADWASLLPPGAPMATYGEGWDDAPWSRTRGGEERYGRQQRAFRLGATAVELEVALGAGDFAAARRLASRLAQRASGLELYPAAGAYENLADRLEADAPPDELRTAANVAEVSLARSLAPGLEAQRFADGKWAETARLAALAGKGELFARLSRQRPEAARTPAIEASLEEIGRILARPEAGENGRERLDAAFAEIFTALGG